MFRRKRRVRLHFLDGPSLEGILKGCVGGHYILENATVKQPSGSVAMSGHAEVPRERVFYIQVNP